MPKLRLQWHHPFSSVVHYMSGGGQSHWPLFPRKARVRGWREQGSGKESKSSLLRSSLSSNSRGKTADLSSPRAPAETRHETIRQSVCLLSPREPGLSSRLLGPSAVRGGGLSIRNICQESLHQVVGCQYQCRAQQIVPHAGLGEDFSFSSLSMKPLE